MKPPALVFLDQGAFIALVTAAAEAYRQECYGVLLGTQSRGRVAGIRCRYAVTTASSPRLLEKQKRAPGP
jgi:hypothetical protein